MANTTDNKEKRIAAFEAEDVFAFLGFFHDDRIDLVLFERVVSGIFSGRANSSSFSPMPSARIGRFHKKNGTSAPSLTAILSNSGALTAL